MIPWLNPHSLEFPDVSLALTEPDGLLAAGGDLSPSRILAAYQQGIFPWFSPGEPILWWSPNPRTVVIPEQFHLSRSMKKQLHKNIFTVTFDQQFKQVMRECAAPRDKQDGTWISDDIIESYHTLHQAGFAHSVEVWQNNQLVGGLYGITLGRIFFGESMFSRVSNASKTGFAHLVFQLKCWDFELIDCQVESEHLLSLGAINMEREEFVSRVKELIRKAPNNHELLHWDQVSPHWHQQD